jgi:hypothetical protein
LLDRLERVGILQGPRLRAHRASPRYRKKASILVRGADCVRNRRTSKKQPPTGCILFRASGVESRSARRMAPVGRLAPAGWPARRCPVGRLVLITRLAPFSDGTPYQWMSIEW